MVQPLEASVNYAFFIILIVTPPFIIIAPKSQLSTMHLYIHMFHAFSVAFMS